MTSHVTELTQDRARLSCGISSEAIYRAIERQIRLLPLAKPATLIDLGCGRGNMWNTLAPHFARYIGVDVFRHQDFPAGHEFVLHDLQQPGTPLPDGCADVAVACETTPCVENPRVLIREAVRLVKPGGWIVITHPNQLSWLSFLTLLFRGQFPAFQDVDGKYMITPLLEADLRRIAAENDLRDVKTFYSESGRIALTPWHYPRFLSRGFPRRLSDNLGILARKTPQIPQ